MSEHGAEGVVEVYGNRDLPEGTEERPLVTFALFAYNQEKYIREAVEGAFAQTYSPLEIILSDDCSSDRTFEIMLEIARGYEGEHRIILHRTAANTGGTKFGLRVWSLLSMARGDFIVLAAGDDVSLPGRTLTLFDCWTKNGRGAVCVHSKATPIGDDGSPFGEPVGNNDIGAYSIAELIYRDGRGLLGATNSISRRLIDEFGPLSEVLLLEDGALAFRARVKDGILFVKRPLVRYRRHENNMTGGKELQSATKFQHYIMGLIGLHGGFAIDLASSGRDPDPQIVNAMSGRIKQISIISGMLHGNLLMRLRAIFTYSTRLPIRRRLYLALCVIGAIKTNAVSL